MENGNRRREKTVEGDDKGKIVEEDPVEKFDDLSNK